jgi:Tfp pilus assembly protein PilV
MFSLNIIKKNRKTCLVSKVGFTLIEVMVSIFVFVLIMIGTSRIFASSISSYRNAKAIQRDLENAQYAMNLMAKTIRTSSVINSSSGSIDIYDYSQGKCIRYALSGNVMKSGSSVPLTPGNKNTCSFSVSGDLTSGASVESAIFSVTKSSKPPVTANPTVGKVTISMKICANSGCSGSEKDTFQIQSSASLRDYGEVGL